MFLNKLGEMDAEKKINKGGRPTKFGEPACQVYIPLTLLPSVTELLDSYLKKSKFMKAMIRKRKAKNKN